MSSATLFLSVPTPSLRRPSLPRLVGIELRKATDTRAGRWLLAVMAILAVAVAVVQVWASDPETVTLQTLLMNVQLPVIVLLPVVGILAVTSEWSQRTALTTFTLVPRRSRVVAAKVVASVMLALVATAATLLVAAGAHLAATALTDAEGSWELTGELLGGTVLLHALNVLVGVAFGLLLLSSPLAIVLFFVLPTIFTVVTSLVDSLQEPARWADFSTASFPIAEGVATAEQWAQLGTSFALWGLLPFILGMIRVTRQDVS